ncbi:uncharacterized protein LOC6526012 [Drosophila yakuba]|uniref:Uncharacterized protein n=1 Tax=Drosophila yakuba TaxID=7245 RepID=B4PXI7_DROYA|nr:uncharacterized protein LOC6526012 [Drosophila yakuba]EDX02938.1 uncharacterized protein Dyak_GE15394 [Drosophila yakuba]
MAIRDIWLFLVTNKRHLLRAIALFLISSAILLFKLDNNVAGSMINLLDLNGGLNSASMWNHNAAVGIYTVSLIMVVFAVFFQRRFRIFDTNVMMPLEDAAKQADEEKEEEEEED